MSDERDDYMRQVIEGTSPSAIQNDPELVLIPVELRDWFAGQAMRGMAQHASWAENAAEQDQNKRLARAAYGLADTMLEARKR
jgi:hypothetical protein